MATNFPDTSVDNTFVTPNRPWADGDIFDDTAESGLIYYWYDPVWKTKAEGDIAAGDLTVSSLNSGPLAGFRNQIINGDFRINQRDETTYDVSSTQYGPDRFTLGGSGEVVYEDITNLPGFYKGVTTVTGVNVTSSVELFPLETNAQFAVGTEWTFSFYTTETSIAKSVGDKVGNFRRSPLSGNDQVDLGNITNVEIFAVGSGWSRVAYTFTVTGDVSAGTNPAALKCLAIAIIGTSNDAATITGVQLEPGPVATPFEHRPIGTELALCQRYYQKYESFTNGNRFDIGVSTSPDNISMNLYSNFPHLRKGVNPTARFGGSVEIMDGNVGTGISSISASGITLSMGAPGQFTGAGQVKVVRMRDGSFISLDVEL